MISNNVPLQFDREENDLVYFKTEGGKAVSFPKEVIGNIEDKNAIVYLSLDHKQLTSSDENHKKLLNELLDN